MSLKEALEGYEKKCVRVLTKVDELVAYSKGHMERLNYNVELKVIGFDEPRECTIKTTQEKAQFQRIYLTNLDDSTPEETAEVFMRARNNTKIPRDLYMDKVVTLTVLYTPNNYKIGDILRIQISKVDLYNEREPQIFVSSDRVNTV